MTYAEGKFYAIQGQLSSGAWAYLECVRILDHRERLREIAKRTTRTPGSYYDDEDRYERSSSPNVKASHSPYEVKLFPLDTKFEDIMAMMRRIRNDAHAADVNPNTIRLVIVESKMEVFTPDEQSKEEIELRKFALDKLSVQEKLLLQVNHWEVYHKLGDRSMLDEDEDEQS